MNEGMGDGNIDNSHVTANPVPREAIAHIAQSGHTHHERNPSIPVQITRKNTKLTASQKATNTLRLQENKAKRELLNQELDSTLEQQQQELDSLAARHGFKPKYVHAIATSSSHFKPKREVNLFNAKVHAKSVEVNANSDKKVPLAEIHRLVKEDDTLNNLTKEAEETIINNLISHRKLKKAGARPTNKGAAIDYDKTMKMLHTEIVDLNSRTGAEVIAISSRSDVNDTFGPSYICSDNVAGFMVETFGMTTWEVCRLFEQWVCTRGKMLAKNPETVSNLQKECSSLVNTGLVNTSGIKNARINYANYDEKTILAYKCKLVGYPLDKMASPYDISRINDLRTLATALRSGECHWVRMSKADLTKHANDIEARKAAGELVGTARRPRKDKGTKRGSKGASKNKKTDENDVGSSDLSESDDDQASPPRKKAKAAPKPRKSRKALKQLPPMQQRSRSILSNTDTDTSETHAMDN